MSHQGSARAHGSQGGYDFPYARQIIPYSTAGQSTSTHSSVSRNTGAAILGGVYARDPRYQQLPPQAYGLGSGAAGAEQLGTTLPATVSSKSGHPYSVYAHPKTIDPPHRTRSPKSIASLLRRYDAELERKQQTVQQTKLYQAGDKSSRHVDRSKAEGNEKSQLQQRPDSASSDGLTSQSEKVVSQLEAQPAHLLLSQLTHGVDGSAQGESRTEGKSVVEADDSPFHVALTNKIAALESLVLIQHRQIKAHARVVAELKERLARVASTYGKSPYAASAALAHRPHRLRTQAASAPSNYAARQARRLEPHLNAIRETQNQEKTAQRQLSPEEKERREQRVQAMIERLYHRSVAATTSTNKDKQSGTATSSASTTQAASTQAHKPRPSPPQQRTQSPVLVRTSKSKPSVQTLTSGIESKDNAARSSRVTAQHASKAATESKSPSTTSTSTSKPQQVKPAPKSQLVPKPAAASSASHKISDAKESKESQTAAAKNQASEQPETVKKDAKPTAASKGDKAKPVDSGQAKEKSRPSRAPPATPLKPKQSSEKPVAAAAATPKPSSNSQPAPAGKTVEKPPASPGKPSAQQPSSSPATASSTTVTTPAATTVAPATAESIVSKPTTTVVPSVPLTPAKSVDKDSSANATPRTIPFRPWLISLRNAPVLPSTSSGSKGVHDVVPDVFVNAWLVPSLTLAMDPKDAVNTLEGPERSFVGSTEVQAASTNADFTTPIPVALPQGGAKQYVRLEVRHRTGSDKESANANSILLAVGSIALDTLASYSKEGESKAAKSEEDEYDDGFEDDDGIAPPSFAETSKPIPIEIVLAAAGNQVGSASWSADIKRVLLLWTAGSRTPDALAQADKRFAPPAAAAAALPGVSSSPQVAEAPKLEPPKPVGPSVPDSSIHTSAPKPMSTVVATSAATQQVKDTKTLAKAESSKKDQDDYDDIFEDDLDDEIAPEPVKPSIETKAKEVKPTAAVVAPSSMPSSESKSPISSVPLSLGQPEVKPEDKPEGKPEVKPVIKPEVKPEVKSEVKSEASGTKPATIAPAVTTAATTATSSPAPKSNLSSSLDDDDFDDLFADLSPTKPSTQPKQVATVATSTGSSATTISPAKPLTIPTTTPAVAKPPVSKPVDDYEDELDFFE